MSECLPSLQYNRISSSICFHCTPSYLPETSHVALDEAWNALVYTEIFLAQIRKSYAAIAYTEVWWWLPY